MDDEWVMDSGWTDGRCSHRFVCSFLWGQSRELGEALGGGGSRAEAPCPSSEPAP